jgi:hypothetical protein
MTLNLSSELEAIIRDRAAANGQDIEAFVLQAVAEKLAEADVQPPAASPSNDEWKKKLQAWIDLHPVVTHFVDDSRESIYAGRGE